MSNFQDDLLKFIEHNMIDTRRGGNFPDDCWCDYGEALYNNALKDVERFTLYYSAENNSSRFVVDFEFKVGEGVGWVVLDTHKIRVDKNYEHCRVSWHDTKEEAQTEANRLNTNND